MASTRPREIRRATPQDFPQLQKLWWRVQLDSEVLEPRITDFQVVVENGRIVAALGLQMAAKQGKIYGETFDDPDRVEEMRALLCPRILTWAKNLGLWRLWTPLSNSFWVTNGFQPHDPAVQIPAEFNADPSPLLVLQLGPEPSHAAAAMGELGLMEIAVRKRRIDFFTRKRMLALYVPLVAGIIKLVIATIFVQAVPPARPLPKPPVFEHKIHTNKPPKDKEPEVPNTIKA